MWIRLPKVSMNGETVCIHMYPYPFFYGCNITMKTNTPKVRPYKGMIPRKNASLQRRRDVRSWSNLDIQYTCTVYYLQAYVTYDNICKYTHSALTTELHSVSIAPQDLPFSGLHVSDNARNGCSHGKRTGSQTKFGFSWGSVPGDDQRVCDPGKCMSHQIEPAPIREDVSGWWEEIMRRTGSQT